MVRLGECPIGYLLLLLEEQKESRIRSDFRGNEGYSETV